MNRRKRAVELFSDFLRSMSRALGCRPCNSQYLQRLPLYRTIQAGTHIQSRSAQICVSMSLCPEQGPNQWTKLILIVLETQSYNCTRSICDRRVMMRQISAHVCPVNYTSRSHTRWQQRSARDITLVHHGWESKSQRVQAIPDFHLNHSPRKLPFCFVCFVCCNFTEWPSRVRHRHSPCYRCHSL